jgi:hypothetical protein
MAMESLGGNLPAGRPAAVFAGGKTHVFAIGAGGVMNHWTIEVTDQYILEKSCKEIKWSELKPQLASGSVFADPDQYVMVAIDPVESGGRTYLSCSAQGGRAWFGGRLLGKPVQQKP